MNIVVDALYRKHALLSVLDSKILGFDIIKEYYEEDTDFGMIFVACLHDAQGVYNIKDGYLSKHSKLYILGVRFVHC